MNCPLCIDQTLEVHHRGGIEIDVCPRCRGVWLDRGELDRLAAAAAPTDPPSGSPGRHEETGGAGEARRVPASGAGKRPKKKSKKKTLAERLGDALEEVLDL